MQAARVASLLTADLSSDARDLLQLGDLDEATVHSVLHQRIGAVGRSLRSVRNGVPLHAAVCELPDGRGVLASADSGFGKSTLVALLGIRSGAAFVSDDTVWIEGRLARGFGAPLAIRAESPFADRARALPYASGTGRLLARPMDLGIPATRESASIDVLLFPSYQSTDAGCDELQPVEAFCRLVAALLRSASDAELITLARLATLCRSAMVRYANEAGCLAVCAEAFSLPPVVSPVLCHLFDGDERAESGLGGGVAAMRMGNDVAVWNPVTGQIACVQDWAKSTPLPNGPAFEELHSMGFVSTRLAEGP